MKENILKELRILAEKYHKAPYLVLDWYNELIELKYLKPLEFLKKHLELKDNIDFQIAKFRLKH